MMNTMKKTMKVNKDLTIQALHYLPTTTKSTNNPIGNSLQIAQYIAKITMKTKVSKKQTLAMS